MTEEGYIIFNRPPRIQRNLPEDTVEIPRPPEPQFKGDRLSILVLILPVVLAILTILAMVLTILLVPRSNIIILLTMGVASLGMIATGTVNILHKITTDRANRLEYLEILADREKQLRDYSRQQQTVLNNLYPALPQIFEWPREQNLRLWERRIGDADFLNLRLGIGSRPSSIKLNNIKLDRKLPLLARAVKLTTDYREVEDVPDIAELFSLTSLGIVGAPERTVPFLRAILCHLTAHHSPEDVKLLATYPHTRSADWNWLGWLPHTRISDSKGNVIPLVASFSDQLETLGNFMLENIKRRDNKRHNTGVGAALSVQSQMQKGKKEGYMFPAMVWAVDDFALAQDEAAIKKLFEVGTELGVFIITTAPDLAGIPTQCRAILEMLPNGRVRYSTSGEKGRITTLNPDMATIEFCEAYALAMAPLKLKIAGDKGEMGSSLRLLDIMGLPTDPNNIFDPLTLWNRSSVGSLKVPVGVVFGGQELYLDVSDKGHGPHGLLAGTTGSGKSELLLTIVSALALANHPDNLNFILGDFKGGATFNPFVNLPHVVGMMSDLDLTIVERAMTAIFSELKRREHLLKEEGVTHIRDYQKKKPKAKMPLPYLLVIIDEFAEMKEQAPDFMDKIINIARTGRTLGVHLILATQRPAGVITGQLNSNTKFRLCLRVETPEDSNDMLGRKDAAMIASNLPGRAFFKVGSDVFEQFQVARVAIPFAPPEEQSRLDQPVAMLMDEHWKPSPLSPEKYALRLKAAKPTDGEAVLPLDYDIISAQCAAAAKRTVIHNTHKPWLDPMESRYSLPQYLKDKSFDPAKMSWPASPPFGYGRAPVALLDNVVEQLQTPFYIDLEQHGSYCISGLAVSGKTTVLRTMLTALALTHSPRQMRFAIFDLSNTLKPFVKLPHRTTYLAMSQQNEMRQAVKDLYDELQNRRQLFADKGVLDLASYWQAIPESEPLPAIFVALENFVAVKHNPPFEMEQLKALIREGRSYGLHVAITMDRANDFEYGRLAEQFFQFALRQQREDVTFNIPKNMVGSWEGKPGRGFIKGSHNRPPVEVHFFLACGDEPENQSKAIEELLGQMEQAVSQHPDLAAPTPASFVQTVTTPLVENQAETEPTPPAPTGVTASRDENYWDDLFALDEEEEVQEQEARIVES